MSGWRFVFLWSQSINQYSCSRTLFVMDNSWRFSCGIELHWQSLHLILHVVYFLDITSARTFWFNCSYIQFNCSHIQHKFSSSWKFILCIYIFYSQYMYRHSFELINYSLPSGTVKPWCAFPSMDFNQLDFETKRSCTFCLDVHFKIFLRERENIQVEDLYR